MIIPFCDRIRAFCTTRNRPILIRADSNGEYVSVAFYLPSEWTPNAAVAHVSAQSYSVYKTFWSRRDIQKSRQARCVRVIFACDQSLPGDDSLPLRRLRGAGLP